jgi:hypothetical protein
MVPADRGLPRQIETCSWVLRLSRQSVPIRVAIHFQSIIGVAPVAISSYHCQRNPYWTTGWNPEAVTNLLGGNYDD